MTTFRISLIGVAQPLMIDLPWASVDELAQAATERRYLTGHLAEADESGVYASIMIATGRIQCVIEAT